LSNVYEKKEKPMSLLLEIPDQVAQAIRLPLLERHQQVMTELALALYARGILSFGKARELTTLSHAEFGRLLGQRDIPRHYTEQELEDDIAYARGQ
jgi:predicted HTH domain antitoxin